MDIKRVLLMVGTTFLFTALFVPVVKKMANFIGALDMPNERKVHKVPIPRLGGLGIYAGFLLGYMLFGIHQEKSFYDEVLDKFCLQTAEEILNCSFLYLLLF